MANPKSEEILSEMISFSVETIKLCQKLPLPPSVTHQITKSITSIGANYSEAQNASSKKDFINKIYIAKKEASETKYWLRIILGLVGSSEDLSRLTQTAQRYLMMLQKIINVTRSPSSQQQIANSQLMDNS